MILGILIAIVAALLTTMIVLWRNRERHWLVTVGYNSKEGFVINQITANTFNGQRWNDFAGIQDSTRTARR